MTRDTRIWLCPKRCGCELRITADWVDASAETDAADRRISYQHPVPRTITDVSIIAVCAEHDHYRTDPLPPDPYGGSPGYIPLPIANPTEAQKLYIQLYRYGGQRWRPDTCDCKIYECVDRFTGDVIRTAHPKHTNKCRHHLADDDNHSAAVENCFRKNRVFAELRSRFAAIGDDELRFRFDDITRLLRITASRLNAQQKVQAQAWCDANLGPGKVVIE